MRLVFQKTQIQHIYQDIFQLVDPASTTKVNKTEVLQTYKNDISVTGYKYDRWSRWQSFFSLNFSRFLVQIYLFHGI